MSREHVIETLEWNVGFGSEAEAFEWQPRLVQAVRGSAVDAIASVFDELSAPGEVLVLDSLTLDLGQLAAEDFEAQMPGRLRACLRDALLNELGARRAGSVDAPPPLTTEASELDTLRHYLSRGYLPWSAGAGVASRLHDVAQRTARESGPALDRWLESAAPQASDRLLRLLAGELAQARSGFEAALMSQGTLDARIPMAWAQLVRWDAEWLAQRLRLRGQSANMRRRMAWAFTREMLLDLVDLFVPAEREFVADVVDQHAAFGRAHAPTVPAGDLRPRLWEFTLTYLLVERGSDFNRRSYMGSVLRQAARHEGLDYEHLLHAMSRALRGVAAPTALQRQMLQLLDELAQDEVRHAPLRVREEAASLQLIAQFDRYGQADDDAAHRKLEQFRALLRGALLADTPPSGVLHHAWTELVRWDAAWLVEQATLHGQDAQVRRRMAHGFAQEMLLELTGLLAPGERVFVQEVLGQPALFARAQAEAHEQATPPGELRPRLWEFTLAYLLVERGSEFNRRSYLGSMLRQMARHGGLNYGELLRSMTNVLRDVAAPTGLQRQMLQLLDGLVREDAETAPARGPVPGSAMWVQRELPAMRFRWQAALATGDLRGPAVHLAWGHLVRHDANWLLRETLARAQGEPLRSRMARDLPEEALMALLELMVPGERGFIEAALAQSMQLHHAGVAPAGMPRDVRVQLWEFTLTFLVVERGSEFNRRSYIGSLLRQMAAHEGLDLAELLEAFASTLRAVGTAGELQRQMLRLTTELLNQCGPADAGRSALEPHAARFKQALRNTGALSPARAEQLGQDVQALLAHGDSRVRVALEEALRAPESAARLAALLPARLLTRVIWLLRREHHYALQRVADLVADAAVAVGTQAPRARVQSLKWRFILRYLFVEGRSFTLADFARRFTEWLAGQLRVPQPAQWRASVAAQAARDKRSAGQAMGQAVAAALVSARPAAAPSPAKAARRAPPVSRASAALDPAQGEPIYVANAGLVLCEPYLPRLFTMLGLTEGSAFRDAASASKAVNLLQFIAMGVEESSEHQLVLNKLLCGLPLAESVDCESRLEEPDKATVDGMLKGMLAHWKVLGGTTPDGLRETFLRRQGRLVRQEDHWLLLVEAGPYDMLLDQLPWGFSMIKYPWMERMIHVQWR